MSRFSRYDTDEERLPEGMTRVGYDADTQVYTFQDADGSYWESAPGSQYGQLTRVGDADHDAHDTEPFLVSEQPNQRSWRNEMGPLLNFGVLIGLTLLLLFWYLHWSASDEDSPSPARCPVGTATYTVLEGDSCWVIAEKAGITVQEILNNNLGLDCDKLLFNTDICLPTTPTQD